MHKYLIAIFIFLSTALFAQSDDFVPYENAADLQTAIEASSKRTETIKSDFTQIKYLDVLEDEIESTGKFLFRAPNYLKWEYIEPYQYTILRKVDKMLINDEGTVKEYDINSNAAFSAINSMMVQLLTGNFFDSGEYDAAFFENSEYYKVALKPNTSQMRDFLDNIELYFSKKDLLVEYIRMNELSGDYTKIVFSQKIMNVAIPESKFSID